MTLFTLLGFFECFCQLLQRNLFYWPPEDKIRDQSQEEEKKPLPQLNLCNEKGCYPRREEAERSAVPQELPAFFSLTALAEVAAMENVHRWGCSRVGSGPRNDSTQCWMSWRKLDFLWHLNGQRHDGGMFHTDCYGAFQLYQMSKFVTYDKNVKRTEKDLHATKSIQHSSHCHTWVERRFLRQISEVVALQCWLPPLTNTRSCIILWKIELSCNCWHSPLKWN